jgi:hypothetical protein
MMHNFFHYACRTPGAQLRDAVAQVSANAGNRVSEKRGIELGIFGWIFLS